MAKRSGSHQVYPGDDKPNAHLLEEGRWQATAPEPGYPKHVHDGLQ